MEPMSAETMDRLEVLARILLAGDVATDLAGATKLLDKIAIHEAAHAMIGLFFGKRPWLLEITADGGGICHWRQPSEEDVEVTTSDDQRMQSLTKLAEISGNETPDTRFLRGDVAKILKAHWSLLELIANRLRGSVCWDAEGRFLGGSVSGSEVCKMWELSFEKEN